MPEWISNGPSREWIRKRDAARRVVERSMIAAGWKRYARKFDTVRDRRVLRLMRRRVA